jgi:hypothetical protein
MTEREIQDLLREMREEPVPADSLARVRAGVEQQIRKRPSVFAWKIAAALAMAGCVVAGFLWLRTGKPVRVEQAVAPEIAQVLPPVEIPALPEIPVRPASRPKRARPRPAVEGVPVSIRIETPDPDVVILLVN